MAILEEKPSLPDHLRQLSNQLSRILRQLPIMSTKTSLVGASSRRSRVVALSRMLIGDCNKNER
jgi:hypothetical protein